MKKIVLTTVLGLVGLSALFVSPASAATVYTDISTSHRAYDEISYLAKGDLTSSDKSFVFSPDAPMTRAHAAAMIGKAIQLSGKSTTGKFSDVSSTNFASGYINEAVTRGIINGYGDGTFRPNVTLTRGEMALLISRAFGYQSATTNDAANELMRKGIALGVGKGNFGTTQTMKRADFAIFLARSVNTDFRVFGNTDSSIDMYVNTNELNFRKGPSTAFEATKMFFEGYPVKVYYTVGDWVYAEGAGASGFFHKAYLSTDQPTIGSTKEPVTIPSAPVRKMLNELKVIIDPGHGDHDPGANGFGYQEKNVVLDISLRMKKYYQQTPIGVQFTRESDVFMTLSNRAAFAQKNDGDIYVSVHANALNGSAHGQETFYYAARNTNDDQSKALSTYVHKRMQEAWGLKDRGIKFGNLAVLRENTVPATLAEIGFIDNKTDNAYIASANRREQMARAIFLGTLDYYYHYDNRPEVGLLYSQFSAKPSAKHY